MRGSIQGVAVAGAALLLVGCATAALACSDEKAAVAAIASKGTMHIDQSDGPEGFAYAMVRQQGHWIYSRGESRDLRLAMSEHEKHPGDMLWFRIGDKKYVTRNQEVLDAALEAFNTQSELTDEDDNLAELQSQLTDEAAMLADKSAALNDRQAAFADRISDLASRISEVRDVNTRVRLQQRIQELRAGLTDLIPMQQVLASQQRLLARRATDLAAQRSKLEVSKVEFLEGVEESIEALLSDAVQNGQVEKD